MKTLVIHPKDSSTDFLKVIYADRDWTVINTNVSKRILKEQISSHDRIVMLGHGCNKGLFGFNKMMIDSNFVYLLREKLCVCIWCFANEFVEKYDLKGSYSGMIISEYEEAHMYNVRVGTLKELEESNISFANAVKESIDSSNFPEDVRKLYHSDSDYVIMFNMDSVYQR